ncbi:MAG: hypothetical protein M1839_008107 [Geoglossum umbratile]|nr:MAG: hypothetical protein M1839_008107 [Geoglossum umbratile]
MVLRVSRRFCGRKCQQTSKVDQSNLCIREGPVTNEAYVSGTFDGWKKTVRLEKKGDVFEKSVDLPLNERILYKFYIDGDWKTDPTAPEVTEDGYTNNILPSERVIRTEPTMSSTDPASVITSTVTPTSTTADLAKNVPLEKDTRGGAAPHDATISSAAPGSSTAGLAKEVPLENKGASSGLPGAFPETPQRLPSEVSVNPIPATAGPGNPIHLQPGEKVPDPSTVTANTIQSTVHDDEELKKKTEDQEFHVSPLPATAGIGNPIHLKPGEPVPDPSTFTQNTITSTVTTDKESFENSGSALPGAPSQPPEAKGTGALDLPPISKNMIPESSLPIGGNGPTIEKDPGVTISSAAPTSTTAALAAKVPLEPKHPAGHGTATANGAGEEAGKDSEGVPEVVKESITQAHVDPEATTNPEAVHEKKEVENELLGEVKREEGTGEPASAATAPGNQPGSRDVSPMTKPTTDSRAEPIAASGVAEKTADKATEAPQTPAKPGNGVSAEEGSGGKPSTDSPATGKKKRFSWLSKVKGELKERLHLDNHKDKK